MRKHALVLCLALLGLIGIPRQADAGLADLIWEMSGPRMIGLGFECEFKVPPKTAADRTCFIALAQIYSNREQRPRFLDARWWLTVEANGYFSTSHDPVNDGRTSDFDWFGVGMIALDPMFAVGQTFGDGGRSRVHSGIGMSVNYLMGDFDPFFNAALKVRVGAYEYALSNRWTAGFGFDLRLYGEGFVAGGDGPNTLKRDGPKELVKSYVFILRRKIG